MLLLDVDEMSATVKEWTCDDVSQWLKNVGLQVVVDKFKGTIFNTFAITVAVCVMLSVYYAGFVQTLEVLKLKYCAFHAWKVLGKGVGPGKSCYHPL